MDWSSLWLDVLISAAVTAVTATIAVRKNTTAELLASAVPYPPTADLTSGRGTLLQSQQPDTKEAHSLLAQEYDGRLVVTTGVVSPISQSAVLHSPTIACVANLHTVVRHSARYDPIFRNWSSDSTEVLRVARQLPFFISQGGSGKPSVIAGVDTDLHAAGLDIYLPTIASNFAPSPPATLGQLALDVLQGERVLGYETTERALPIGTRLTAVGVLDFSRTVSSVENASGWANAGAAVIPAPEGEVSVPLLIAKDGQPFLLTTSSFTALVSSLRTSALHFKFLTLVPALVTGLLLGRRLYRVYLEHLARKAVRDLRARRRNSRKDLSNPDIGALTEEKKTDEGLCVICLEKPRDTVILPCGHFFFCSGCAAQCETCPVCRGVVEDTVKTFS